MSLTGFQAYVLDHVSFGGLGVRVNATSREKQEISMEYGNGMRLEFRILGLESW